VDIVPDIPIYTQIKRELKNQIENGELSEGARVPSEFELARIYGVSRNPTRQALRDLELEGYITRTPGRGSFVAPRAQHQRLFRVGNWRTLAVACPHLECHYTRSLIQGFIQAAAEEEFHTMVYFLRFSDDAEVEFLADIRNSGIEGLAVWLQHASDRTIELLNRFHRASFPFVMVDRFIQGLESDFVVTDNEDAAYQLTHALIARGHKDVGLVTSEQGLSSAVDRFAGYRRALEEAGIPFNKELVGVFPPGGEPPQTVVARFMARRNRPTAFFCVNDGIAYRLYEELHTLGFRVPEEVDLAAIDDNRLSETLNIPMLTAEQTGYEMGRESARILLARIADSKLPFQQRYLSARITLNHADTATPVDAEKDHVPAP